MGPRWRSVCATAWVAEADLLWGGAQTRRTASGLLTCCSTDCFAGVSCPRSQRVNFETSRGIG
jgi:hypothetical protein